MQAIRLIQVRVAVGIAEFDPSPLLFTVSSCCIPHRQKTVVKTGTWIRAETTTRRFVQDMKVAVGIRISVSARTSTYLDLPVSA
jgi:hypothetical protein